MHREGIIYSFTGIYKPATIVFVKAATLSALAEPNRFKIVELLREQPRTVNQLAELLQIRQPQVSKHLRILHEADLVSIKPVAQQRIYMLNPSPFIDLENWAESFQQHWDQKLSNLEAFLAKNQS